MRGAHAKKFYEQLEQNRNERKKNDDKPKAEPTVIKVPNHVMLHCVTPPPGTYGPKILRDISKALQELIPETVTKFTKEKAMQLAEGLEVAGNASDFAKLLSLMLKHEPIPNELIFSAFGDFVPAGKLGNKILDVLGVAKRAKVAKAAKGADRTGVGKSKRVVQRPPVSPTPPTARPRGKKHKGGTSPMGATKRKPGGPARPKPDPEQPPGVPKPGSSAPGAKKAPKKSEKPPAPDKGAKPDSVGSHKHKAASKRSGGPRPRRRFGRREGFDKRENAMLDQAERDLADAGYDVSPLETLIKVDDMPTGTRAMTLDDGVALGRESFKSRQRLNHVLEEELRHHMQKRQGRASTFGRGTARRLEEEAGRNRRFPDDPD